MSTVRPLAILTLLLGALFTLKALAFADGASMFFESRAEARESAAANPPAPAEEDAREPYVLTEPVPDPAPERTSPPARTGPGDPGLVMTDPTVSQGQLLTALAERRRALDAREAELDTREGLIQVAERRVESRIARLNALQGEIQTLLGELDESRQDEINALVDTYASLEPDSAAVILRQMDETDPETVLLVSRELQAESPRRFAAVVGEMADLDPVFAASLTSRLRARAAPPETLAQLEAELDAAAN